MSISKGYLYGLGAVLLWSGFILVSRLGGISELTPYDVIAIRYVVCSAILLPIWWFKFRFSLWNARLIVLGLIGGLGYALCAFNGFEQAPASHAALLLPGLMPFFIVILSSQFSDEELSLEKWLGITVISVGVMALFWQRLGEGVGLSSGHGFLIGAALCWSVFSVLLKRWQISPWHATVSLAFVTAIVYLPAYLLWLPKSLSFNNLTDLGGDIILQAVYQGVSATIVQMLLYVGAVQLIGAAGMGALMAWVPLIAGFSAIYWLNEPFDIALVISLALVSIGSYLTHTSILNNLLLAKGESKYALRKY